MLKSGSCRKSIVADDPQSGTQPGSRGSIFSASWARGEGVSGVLFVEFGREDGNTTELSD